MEAHRASEEQQQKDLAEEELKKKAAAEAEEELKKRAEAEAKEEREKKAEVEAEQERKKKAEAEAEVEQLQLKKKDAEETLQQEPERKPEQATSVLPDVPKTEEVGRQMVVTSALVDASASGLVTSEKPEVLMVTCETCQQDQPVASAKMLSKSGDRWQCARCVRVDLALARKVKSVQWLRDIAQKIPAQWPLSIAMHTPRSLTT